MQNHFLAVLLAIGIMGCERPESADRPSPSPRAEQAAVTPASDPSDPVPRLPGDASLEDTAHERTGVMIYRLGDGDDLEAVLSDVKAHFPVYPVGVSGYGSVSRSDTSSLLKALEDEPWGRAWSQEDLDMFAEGLIPAASEDTPDVLTVLLLLDTSISISQVDPAHPATNRTRLESILDLVSDPAGILILTDAVPHDQPEPQP